MSISSGALTAQQMVELRLDLERTLRRLERRLESNGNGRPAEIDQSAVGRLSRTEALQNQNLTDSLRERERTQLDEVLQALTRLDEGTYGVCTACGGPIGFDRLVVFPETRTCAGCRNGR